MKHVSKKATDQEKLIQSMKEALVESNRVVQIQAKQIEQKDKIIRLQSKLLEMQMKFDLTIIDVWSDKFEMIKCAANVQQKNT